MSVRFDVEISERYPDRDPRSGPQGEYEVDAETFSRWERVKAAYDEMQRELCEVEDAAHPRVPAVTDAAVTKRAAEGAGPGVGSQAARLLARMREEP